MLESATLDRPADAGAGSAIAHLVPNPAAVTEAYVMGTTVRALCGALFVPSRDPKPLPLCEDCAERFSRVGPWVR